MSNTIKRKSEPIIKYGQSGRKDIFLNATDIFKMKYKKQLRNIMPKQIEPMEVKLLNFGYIMILFTSISFS